jgi:hypothetical protein
MKVITNAPILTNVSSNYDIASADFSGVNGTTEPSQTEKLAKEKQGLTWDKITGGWTKAQESGMVDTLLGLFGKGRQTQNTTGTYNPLVQPTGNLTTEKEDEGMSTGMKIGLAIGGVAVVGAIIYFATRKK